MGVKDYIKGRDPSAWTRKVPIHKRVAQREAYPGIDIDYHGAAGSLEYDFAVHPGADPSRIRIRFEEGTRLKLLPDGSLEASVGSGRLVHKAPRASCKGRPVPASFRKTGPREVGFRIGAYDRSGELIIDPEVLAISLSGDSGEEKIVAGSGGAFTGTTTSIGFPTGNTAARTSTDFVVRLSGVFGVRTLVIGGDGEDLPRAMATMFDGRTRVVVVGETNSRNLPASGGIQPFYGGGDWDGFVFIGSEGGFQLTYWGGSGTDRLTSAGGSNFVTWIGGSTDSDDFPGARSFPAARRRGGLDGAVLTLQTPGFGAEPLLVGVELIGGSADDVVLGISYQASSSSVLHILGETESQDFPQTGADTQSLSGRSDGFWITRLASNAPSFSRLCGGAGRDRLTAANMVFGEYATATGETESPDIAGYRGGSDVLIASFDAATPEAALRLRAFGGHGDESVHSTRITGTAANPVIELLGSTSSRDLPVIDAMQARHGGGATDGMLLWLGLSGNLLRASYLGGDGDDALTGVCGSHFPPLSSTQGTVYCGWTNSARWSLSALAGRPEIPSTRGGSDWMAVDVVPGTGVVAPDIDVPLGGFVPLTYRIFGYTPVPQVTVTVENPAIARLAIGPDPASATNSIRVNANENVPYTLTGRAEAGSTRVRFSAPGMRDSFATVRSAPVEGVLIPTGFRNPQLGGDIPFQISTRLMIDGVAPGSVRFQSAPSEEQIPWRVQILTPDTVAFSTSGADPAALEVSPLGPFFSLRTLAAGPYRLVVSRPGTSVRSSEFEGEVVAPPSGLSIDPLLEGIGAGFYSSVRVTAGPNVTSIRASVEPEGVAAIVSGSELVTSLEIPVPSPASARTLEIGIRMLALGGFLAEGMVTLTIEASGSERLRKQLRVFPAGLALGPALAESIPAGQSRPAATISTVHIDPRTGGRASVAPLIGVPGDASITAKVRVSPPEIAGIEGGETITFRASDPFTLLRIEGRAEGTAVIDVRESGYPFLGSGQSEVRVAR